MIYGWLPVYLERPGVGVGVYSLKYQSILRAPESESDSEPEPDSVRNPESVPESESKQYYHDSETLMAMTSDPHSKISCKRPRIIVHVTGFDLVISRLRRLPLEPGHLLARISGENDRRIKTKLHCTIR